MGWLGKNVPSLLTGTDSDLQLLQDDLCQEHPRRSLFSLFSQAVAWLCTSKLHLVLQLFTITHYHGDSKSSDRIEEMEEETPSLRSAELTNISQTSLPSGVPWKGPLAGVSSPASVQPDTRTQHQTHLYTRKYPANSFWARESSGSI